MEAGVGLVGMAVSYVMMFLVGLHTGAGFEFFQEHLGKIQVVAWISIAVFWILFLLGI